MLGWTGASSVVLTGAAAPALAALPSGTNATAGPLTDTGTLLFERQNYNDGLARFAGHSSHASHASHASHSSHYSSSGGGDYVPPQPPPAPTYVAPAPAAPTPPPQTTATKPTAVDKLVMVMRVQSKLHDLGYYTGTIDGKLGPKTIDALRRYQTVNGYPVTGKMDDTTLAGLGIVY